MGRKKGSKNKVKGEIKPVKVKKVPKVEDREIAFTCLSCGHKIYYKKGERSSDMAVDAIQNGCNKCQTIDVMLRIYLMGIKASKIPIKPAKPLVKKPGLSKVIKKKSKRKAKKK